MSCSPLRGGERERNPSVHSQGTSGNQPGEGECNGASPGRGELRQGPSPRATCAGLSGVLFAAVRPAIYPPTCPAQHDRVLTGLRARSSVCKRLGGKSKGCCSATINDSQQFARRLNLESQPPFLIFFFEQNAEITREQVTLFCKGCPRARWLLVWHLPSARGDRHGRQFVFLSPP